MQLRRRRPTACSTRDAGHPVPRIGPVLLLVACACSARVQHGLDERQANALQTVLIERGFHARKVMEDGRPPTWAIEVAPADAADAIRILAELGLPRARPAGVRELLKPGLVPDPLEQHALLVEAQAGELSRTLEEMDGVLSARVHLVRPQTTRVGAPGAPPKAAVSLRVRPGAAAGLRAMDRDLRALVAGSVEGLEPGGVTLVVSEVVSAVPPRAPSAATGGWMPGRIGGVVLSAGALVGLVALGARRLLRPRPRQGAAAASLALRPVVQAPVAEREPE